MLFVSLLLIGALVWQEEFTANRSTMLQLYEYNIDITHQDGTVLLKSNPAKEGAASAWYHCDRETDFCENDVLLFTVKVHANNLRLKYFYRKKDSQAYWGGEVVVPPSKNWQTIKIPLKSAMPFYSGNYPFALTPGKTPALFVFFDNLVPGKFDAVIDKISVLKADAGGEE